MAIKCGNCKGHHDSVADVRSCCLSDQQVAGLPGVTYGQAAMAFADREDKAAYARHEQEQEQGAYREEMRKEADSYRAARRIPTQQGPRGYAVVKQLRKELADELTALVPGHGKYRVAVCLPYDGDRVRFFHIDTPRKGTWAGCVFVKEQAGDDLHPVKGAAREELVLHTLLEFGAKEAMMMYAQELGHCGICGRTLTDEESRELGIGPVCAAKAMGW